MTEGTKGEPAHRDTTRTWWSRRAVPVLILFALICGLGIGTVKQAIDSSAAARPSASWATPTSSAGPALAGQGTSRPLEEPAPPSELPPPAEPSAAAATSAVEALAPPTHASASVSAPAGPAASAPVRLSMESAHLSVQVLELTPNDDEVASQSIVPPLTDDGYWLSSYGKPGLGSTNTTYLAGHSWEGREAPFNRLSTHAAPGDTITLETQTGTLDYVVDTIATYNKETLKNSDIWNVVPNQLVIISCYTEDLWGKNVVITASPA
ncbi:class F sortase [Arthrobacter sp. 260]|uniref:sortase domain-containing protein n=1 Tax=Arthrobacter sp. 260 TaxID=2735314 RepID=UPI0014916A8D|nr:class F sortase [Arthrobacter sp. 260]